MKNNKINIIIQIIIIVLILFSCERKKPLNFEKEYTWNFIEKSTKIDKKQILRNYENQIKILENKDEFRLFGSKYKKVKKKKINSSGFTGDSFSILYDSSRYFDYFKFNKGIYFKKDYEHKDVFQIYYKFYKFNPKTYKIEFIDKKIKVPRNGPGGMGKNYSGKTTHYIDHENFWYCSFDTKQFHWWRFDNKYIDTFNMNVDNKYFYVARTFLMLPKYNKNDLLITPNFVTGNHFKTNRWWLKKPLLYSIDMVDNTYSNIDLDFKIKNEHNYIASIDNGYFKDETVILMGTEPVILFLNKNYKIIKKLDLKKVYKKYDLKNLYENYKLIQPWGKVFNISDKYLIVMTPIFHFSDYNKISIEGIKNSKEFYDKWDKIVNTEEVGNRKDVKKRVAILINKKTKKIEKSELVQLPVFSHDYYFMGPFLNVDYFILKEMKYIIINLKYTKQLKALNNHKERKWNTYYYVYKKTK